MPEPIKQPDQADGTLTDVAGAERSSSPGQVTTLFSRASPEVDQPEPAATQRASARHHECLTVEQLQSLRRRASEREVEDDRAEELSAALGLAARIRARGLHIDAAFDRLSFIIDCVLAEKPRLILARDERLRLQREMHYQSGPISRTLARLSAGSPAALVLVALFISLVAWTIVVFTLHVTARQAVSDLAYEAFFMNGKALLVITSAAFVGGVVSIATRLREFSAVRDLDPFAMFWTALLKPLIGVVLALFLLATLAGDVISFGFLGNNPLELATGPNGTAGTVKERTYYILWVLGFLAGFSERFAWDFVDRAQGAASGGIVGEKRP
jgi:hypothetical protein